MTQRSGHLRAFTRPRLGALILLRFLVGWHLFYAGFARLLAPNWSVAGHFSQWSGAAADGLVALLLDAPTALFVLDQAVAWVPTLAGAALCIGLFTQGAALVAILLLLARYLADLIAPGGGAAAGPTFIVSETMIALFSTVVIYMFPTGTVVGIDVLLERKRTEIGMQSDGI